MRLLGVHSFALEEFFEPHVPKYAILSHTWEKEEILFEDIPNREQAEKKTGFQKVEKARELAKSQDYEYIWIDTCCINKSSSAELTEAINSMYRWYKNSDVCYAFLSDVTGGKHSPSLSKQLRKSRWFKRGWTLQELLAPDNVQFYNYKWENIGNKKEDPLFSIISDTTNIDEGILRGGDILQIGIARRMYWASGRETTRIEDLAYSLLGIFDINMPLIYGEGQKAFRRLQEEILKTTDDQSIFAWHNAKLEGDPVDVLAIAPSDFNNSGSISPYTPFRANRKATSITNQGIAVELPILSIPSPLHTDHSPFEEIEAILDCQLGSAPGTFPTIRLRSVEKGGASAQRHYYRIMAGETMTKVKNHNDLDLFTGNVIGFDPTQLHRDIYKSTIDKLNWNYRVETIIITRHIPKPKSQLDLIQIPWSLSLLASEYAPDNTPFWLAPFSSQSHSGKYEVDVKGAYPRERWDKSLRQMRVSLLPRAAFSYGGVCQIEGIFDIQVYHVRNSIESATTAKSTLIIGRKSFDRRDSHIRPWCQIMVPPIGADMLSNYMDTYNNQYITTWEVPAGELASNSSQLVLDERAKLNASVQTTEVSGRFYHMVNVYAIGQDSSYYYPGLRLLD
ncbi:HET-domain-containing protein [Nemania sp. FL0031]|nr:HET-domain-containing protein [Nemania sp. FL0031]